MTTDPGSVPSNASPLHIEDNNSGINKPFNKTIKVCKRCDSFKPPRAHHCSSCNKCIVKMDHHCPWVNNCKYIITVCTLLIL